ncbi:MAG TPA: hypothetical protein VGB50_00190 [Flavobacterium sp.]|jgi:hypothetical protein
METITLTLVINGVESEVVCEILARGGIWQAAIIQDRQILEMINATSLMDCFANLVKELNKLGEVVNITGSTKPHYPLLLESHLRLLRSDILLRKPIKKKSS